jgi:hypothetical protein
MSDAEKRPLGPDVVETTKGKLSKTSGVLDLSNDRFNNLFSQPVPTSIAAAFDLGRHCHHERLLLKPSPCGFGLVALPPSSAGQVRLDTSFGQLLERMVVRSSSPRTKSRMK